MLNRPQALNALSLGMLHRLRELFDQWAHDANVYAVVASGSGEKAFCAGADLGGAVEEPLGEFLRGLCRGVRGKG